MLYLLFIRFQFALPSITWKKWPVPAAVSTSKSCCETWELGHRIESSSHWADLKTALTGGDQWWMCSIHSLSTTYLCKVAGGLEPLPGQGRGQPGQVASQSQGWDIETTTHSHTHIHTSRQFRVSSPHVANALGLWKEVGEPPKGEHESSTQKVPRHRNGAQSFPAEKGQIFLIVLCLFWIVAASWQWLVSPTLHVRGHDKLISTDIMYHPFPFWWGTDTADVSNNNFN